MKIGIDTRLGAILGTDIGHSKSPAMMNAAFEKKEIDFYYFPINVSEENFEDVIKGISKMNFFGVTLTIPYKIIAMKYIDEIDPLAEVIGAVNTVEFKDGRLIGHNTDGLGFVEGLKRDAQIDIKESVFAVFGAGGAARAISVVLASESPKKIFIFNRTYEKAVELCEHINKNVRDCCEPVRIDGDLGRYIGQSDVLINTTNVGMYPNVERSVIDREYLHPGLTVVDIIYNPRKTKLLKDAETIGCQILNGESLLLHQGKIAFKIWTGLEAPELVMAAAIQENK